MKKSKKLTKVFYILGLALLVFGLVYFNFRLGLKTTQAQINYQQDSDYDGLTDQAENNVYHTDPFKADTDGDGYLDSAEVLAGNNPLNSRDPADSLIIPGTPTPPVVTKTISSLPWYVARAAGTVSYVLMFLVVIIGTGLTTSYTYKLTNPTKAWIIHKYLSLALGITLIVHIASLLFDKFINLRIAEVLIPFYSIYNTTFLSLGIFAFYLLVIIIFSSLFFRLKSPRIWRLIHYSVYLLFILSFLHGVLMGTDTKTLVMKLTYWITGISFLLLLIYRFWRSISLLFITKKTKL